MQTRERYAGPLKRYLVFAGDIYYPGRGWFDYVGSADSLADALVIAKNARPVIESASPEWWQIIDSTTGKIVDEWAKDADE